jgi:vacuolar-type H+-ATPase subunit F/Vma7
MALSPAPPRGERRPALEVRVLCRREIAAGFELAGVEPIAVASDAEAAEALRRLARERRVGVVLIEERLHHALPHELVARIDRASSPLLVPFPSPAFEGRGLAEEYVLAILRQAVGYRVRPR